MQAVQNQIALFVSCVSVTFVFALLLFQQNCLGPLMNVLKEHIIVMEKEHLISHQAELTAFFMKALDYRTDHAQVAWLGEWTEAAQLVYANSVGCF